MEQEMVSTTVRILRQVLQIPEDIALNRETELLGSLPELDSMAVVNILTAIEEEYDIEIDDDEVTGAIFETVESLSLFVQQKAIDGN